MNAYPVMLDVARCRVLVVGGGVVAGRKIRGLVECGGRPEVVAPRLSADTAALVDAAGLVWHARGYAAHDARRRHLVFVATDDGDVNARAAADARAHGALVAIADDGEGSDVHLPAVLREGDVVVALSTGGAAPLLARRLRDRFAAIVTPGLGRTARRMALLRRDLRACMPDEAARRAFWQTLITPDLIDAAVRGADADVEDRIKQCLSRS